MSATCVSHQLTHRPFIRKLLWSCLCVRVCVCACVCVCTCLHVCACACYRTCCDENESIFCCFKPKLVALLKLKKCLRACLRMKMDTQQRLVHTFVSNKNQTFSPSIQRLCTNAGRVREPCCERKRHESLIEPRHGVCAGMSVPKVKAIVIFMRSTKHHRVSLPSLETRDLQPANIALPRRKQGLFTELILTVLLG